MKHLYQEYFKISKHEKIREKVMLVRITVTVTIMLVCMAAMGFSAYAYFSDSIVSGSNILRAATFETEITVKDENGTALTIEKVNAKESIVKLEAGKTYRVTIDEGDISSASTGFVVLTADGCDLTYHTQQLGDDAIAPGGRTETIQFDLTVSSATDVRFLSHWGTSSYYAAYTDSGNGNAPYITNENTADNKIIITITPQEEP